MVKGKSRLQVYKNCYEGSPFSSYVPDSPSLLGVWGVDVLFKKAEMEKNLRTGLSLCETDPLNHKWLDFAI